MKGFPFGIRPHAKNQRASWGTALHIPKSVSEREKELLKLNLNDIMGETTLHISIEFHILLYSGTFHFWYLRDLLIVILNWLFLKGISGAFTLRVLQGIYAFVYILFSRMQLRSFIMGCGGWEN